MNDGDINEDKNSNVFAWILAILVLGLILGSVTSTCSHLKDDMAENDYSNRRISESFDHASIKDDMQKALLVGKDNGDILLRSISSSLGTYNYLKIRPTENYGPNLGICDIKGENEELITAVVVELGSEPSLAKSALIGSSIATIKSLAGEKNFSHTLRFVFLTQPSSLKKLEKELTLGRERLDSYILLRTSPLLIHSNAVWMPISAAGESSTNGEIWTHTALMVQPGNEPSDELVDLTLEAARQLHAILKAKLTK